MIHLRPYQCAGIASIREAFGQLRKRAPDGVAASIDPTAHPDWPWPPSSQDVALERDLARLLERIEAERSALRRHAMWRVYAAKVRMRSDAEIRRCALRQAATRAEDDALERRIDAAYQQIVTAGSRADRVAAMESLRGLVRLRSAAQVARMERSQGLASKPVAGGILA